ncbi:MAG: hypothetical protein ACKVJG_24635 [Candidatus Latescibacterota bacterium]|jgi:hypothetical protein|tara:strand:- start:346 stop:480 length:135 start_codon:yes stop_codon:yes gene_type:complete
MNHIDIKGDAIAEIQRNFKKTPKPDFWGWAIAGGWSMVPMPFLT